MTLAWALGQDPYQGALCRTLDEGPCAGPKLLLLLLVLLLPWLLLAPGYVTPPDRI